MVFLGLTLTASPALGQEILAPAIEAAHRLGPTNSVPQSQTQKGSMNRGWFWTGVSLVAAGGFFAAYANEIAYGGDTKAVRLLGAVVAATGAGLFGIGVARRPTLPEVTFGPSKFAVHKRFTF